MRKLIPVLVTVSLLLGCVVVTTSVPAPQSTLFAKQWNRGRNPAEPVFHVQRIDEHTYALRQSLRQTFEAPFLYLLFGEDKVLLIDSGVEGADLRAEVDRIIAEHGAQRGQEVADLVVMHTHGHNDHIGGDANLEARPNTTVVGHEPAQVAEFFAIDSWPTRSAEFDLGNRVVEVLPTPGHQDAHVMIYDRSSKILFSGDALYPGRLFFQCGKLDTYRDSVARLREWLAERPLDWVLGAHIEMKPESGQSFNSERKSRSAEHLLELQPTIIDELHRALIALGDQPRVQPHAQFVLFPHPANPAGKKPPDWCLEG